MYTTEKDDYIWTQFVILCSVWLYVDLIFSLQFHMIATNLLLSDLPWQAEEIERGCKERQLCMGDWIATYVYIFYAMCFSVISFFLTSHDQCVVFYFSLFLVIYVYDVYQTIYIVQVYKINSVLFCLNKTHQCLHVACNVLSVSGPHLIKNT